MWNHHIVSPLQIHIYIRCLFFQKSYFPFTRLCCGRPRGQRSVGGASSGVRPHPRGGARVHPGRWCLMPPPKHFFSHFFPPLPLDGCRFLFLSHTMTSRWWFCCVPVAGNGQVPSRRGARDPGIALSCSTLSKKSGKVAAKVGKFRSMGRWLPSTTTIRRYAAAVFLLDCCDG